MLAKSVLNCLLAYAMVITLGCSPGGNSSTQGKPTDTLAAIESAKLMRVGYLEWAPCIVRQPNGPPRGIFARMVEEIARRSNMKVEWVETTLATFTTGLATRQFDFSVGPTFVTVPRALAVSFTRPIAYVGNSAVVRRDSALGTEGAVDLGRQGLRIAVLQGQAMDEYISANYPAAELLRLGGADLTGPLVAVTSGQADIGFMNSITVGAFSAKHPEVRETFVGEEQLEILPLAWATRADDFRLRDFLDAAIVYLAASGRTKGFQAEEPLKLLYPPTLR